MSETELHSDDSLRLEAIAALKKRRDFHKHVTVYLLVNAALVTIWVITNAGGFFWPVFPIVFWGNRRGDERLGRLLRRRLVGADDRAGDHALGAQALTIGPEVLRTRAR